MKNYTGEDNGDAHLKRQIGEDGKKTKIGYPYKILKLRSVF